MMSICHNVMGETCTTAQYFQVSMSLSEDVCVYVKACDICDLTGASEGG